MRSERLLSCLVREHGGGRPGLQSALELLRNSVDGDDRVRPCKPGCCDDLEPDAAAANDADALPRAHAGGVAHRARSR